MAVLTPNTIDLPKFAESELVDGLTGQNNVVPAIVADQDFGWHPARRRPERNVMNWLHRFTYRQLKHMKEVFQPEVEQCLVNGDVFIQAPYYIAGLQVDITEITIDNHPITAEIQPGRLALSDMTLPVSNPSLIVVDVPVAIHCNTNAQWIAGVPGVANYHDLVPGIPEDLHLFLMDIDPATGTPNPKLAFSFEGDGSDLLNDAAIAAEGYTHMRRIFSFRCRAIGGAGGNVPHLPFARIADGRLSWADHVQHSNNTPGPVSFGGGAGPAWTELNMNNFINDFDIPGSVAIIMQMMFTTRLTAVTGNSARIRGGNLAGKWNEDSPVDNLNRTNDVIPLSFDAMPHIYTEMTVSDANLSMISFIDLTVPHVGNNWIGMYILGYKHLGTDFPHFGLG